MKISRTAIQEIYTDYTPEEWHKLRSEVITSTDAAALFGISPYLTPFELWHRKKDKTIVEITENERMVWGTRLQDAIARGICEDQGWSSYRRKDEFVRRLDIAGMGASFDYEVTVGGEMPLLEIKNVDSLAFKEGWLIDGDNVEAPAHIELQLQHQMAVAGRKLAYIGALIGGNRVVLIKRERDQAVIDALESKIMVFWDSVAHNREPKPDFAKDAGFIAKLYRYAEPGKIYNAEGDVQLSAMVDQYKAMTAAIKSAQETKDEIKARILMQVKDAEKVIGNGWSISAGLIGPCHMDYDRAGYRDFKIYKKKETANAH
jgi:putative phage-type endonuclease